MREFGVTKWILVGALVVLAPSAARANAFCAKHEAALMHHMDDVSKDRTALISALEVVKALRTSGGEVTPRVRLEMRYRASALKASGAAVRFEAEALVLVKCPRASLAQRLEEITYKDEAAAEEVERSYPE